ncbi:hypothetical protein [Paraburkholderia strydomiana]|uniref:hypothetical protein n=1 Tax=Paraburkholderia strydomiana TaxID=1245417 RepID=UPI0038B9AC53
MNVAYFAVLQAISATLGHPLVRLDTQDDIQNERETGGNFHTHYVASDERIDVYCYNPDFYPKLIAAVASAASDLRAYEIDVPNVNFQMVA